MAEAAISDNSEDAERYNRIHEFKFQDNFKFLEGWRKLVDVVPEGQLADSYIRAQVFFYSREVEQVDLECYKRWLKENNKQLKVPDAQTLVKLSRDAEHTEARSDTVKSQSDKTEDVADTGQAGRHPASFAELIAMVHNGIPLPDTEDIAIEPTNEEPSSPVMQRPKKPWEIDVN